MAHYTFDIIKYYIAATFKAEKAYPADKYVHQLIDTDAEKWPVNATIF